MMEYLKRAKIPKELLPQPHKLLLQIGQQNI